MSTPIYDSFGDEMSPGDVEDNMPSPRYRALLRLYPDCRDPEHPGCEKCEDPETGEPIIDKTPMVEIAVADVKRIGAQLKILYARVPIDELADSEELEPMIELLESVVYDATGEEL